MDRRLPDVENILRDDARDVTYRVMAFRRLTKEEMKAGVRMYLAKNKGKPPKQGSTVTIISLID